MKKLMCLGGNYYQMTATKAARRLGCHVINVDYYPDNPAHKYADEYYNVSTVEKERVLELAEQLQIDGIISYASDVSAPTAAYVAEKMNLPSNPYESVLLMTRKDMFRPFLEANGFNVPKGKAFDSIGEAEDFFRSIKKPVMVKPVDASGSKGVFKVEKDDSFKQCFEGALSYSRAKRVIVEEFIQRNGYQVAGDGFIVNERLVFAGFMNDHFDNLCNPLVLTGESYPSVLPAELKEKGRAEIQRCLNLLNMKMGAINLEFIVDDKGEVYIIEIGPRNGGNLIPDAIYCACGVDLAEYTVKAALGMDCSDLKEKDTKEYISSYIVHSLNDGIFERLQINESIEKDIVRQDLFIERGQNVHRFENGGFGIGAMLIRHKSIEEMCYRMDHMEEFINVKLY